MGARQSRGTRTAAQAAVRAGTAWRVPAALLVLSGAAGLVYQVLWVKQLSLVLGVDVHAVTVGVSAFFAGLALGGWTIGRWADRAASPWRLYLWLECAIAVLALGATVALAHAAAPFAWLETRAGIVAWALPVLLVALPAVAMGGTMPVLLRAIRPSGELGAHGGRLYAANTAGAIAGTLLAAFVAIPLLGVFGSACTAAGLNLLAGAGALWQSRRVPTVAVASPSPSTAPTPVLAQRRLALGLYAVAGGIALGYEVVWSQAIVQFLSTRAFAFAVVLATYLAGLVLGSALVARRVDRSRDPWSAFALLVVGAGLVALVEFAWLGEWLPALQSAAYARVLEGTGNLLAASSARFTVAALCIVFVPTVLLGAAFPYAVRLSVDPARVGAGLGAVLALNTLGGIAGSVLAGVVLVPWIGVVHTLGVLAAASALVAVLAMVFGDGVTRRARVAIPLLAVVTLMVAVATPADRLARLLAQARGGELVFYEESRGATVAVVEQSKGTQSFRRLYIQGVSNSGDTMTSLRYMRLQALLPLIVHNGTPRSALVIGLGTGITAGALLQYPGLEHRVVAELLPAVVRAAPSFQGNFDASHDKRIDIRLRDGRRELLQGTQRYDLVTLEPPPPSASGVVNLYSREFYQLAASRLQPGGIVAQWLPLPTQNRDDTRSLVRSFLDVFPHASLWTTELHEMLLVGSAEPLALDVPTIAARFQQPEVASALRAVGVASPAALLATYITDRDGLDWFAGDAPAVTDDRPRIEYTGWVRQKAFVPVLRELLALQSDPPLTGADDSLQQAIRRERDNLQTFYAAGLDAYEGNRQAWSHHITEAIQADPDNPYYRWFTGGGR
ncbi:MULTISPECIES: fused MFS/spermidine synthase [Cupriavidus]|uniref:Spermidine synthase n=1 Tax=Cupriavidus campinensis TaxID=151783 RepID=A0AAE9L2S4_9BURK|nr:fused MFS/spermidine synthase [Cupriavidus campinensis]TSP12157.1 spermidine synthase [Cupriavidus campinensis]URF06192.1 fused MFS/spermidine synthase [Cupriavidus campinensis]